MDLFLLQLQKKSISPQAFKTTIFLTHWSSITQKAHASNEIKTLSRKIRFPEREIYGCLKNAEVVHNGQLFIWWETRASEPVCIVRMDNVSPYLRDCVWITRVAKANEWIVIESIARMVYVHPVATTTGWRRWLWPKAMFPVIFVATTILSWSSTILVDLLDHVC